MSKKTLGLIMIVGGLVLVVVMLTADMIGIGGNPNVIGWKQLSGAAVGLVIAIAGFWLNRGSKGG